MRFDEYKRMLLTLVCSAIEVRDDLTFLDLTVSLVTHRGIPSALTIS